MNDQAARTDAKASGAGRYQSVTPCKHGHVGLRFTADNKCCECNRLNCLKRKAAKRGPEGLKAQQERQERWDRLRAEKAERSARYSTIRAERQRAIASGDAKYTSLNKCPKGHDGERYTGSGGCVQCALNAVANKVRTGYYREYYAANSEKISDRSRKYHRDNTESRTANAKAWVAANPEKRAAISMNYKARRRSQEEAGITGGVLAAWTLSQPKVCFYCAASCSVGFHVDHFIPLARGGAHVLTNLRIACAPCNLKKNAKMPDEFMREEAA